VGSNGVRLTFRECACRPWAKRNGDSWGCRARPVVVVNYGSVDNSPAIAVAVDVQRVAFFRQHAAAVGIVLPSSLAERSMAHLEFRMDYSRWIVPIIPLRDTPARLLAASGASRGRPGFLGNGWVDGADVDCPRTDRCWSPFGFSGGTARAASIVCYGFSCCCRPKHHRRRSPG